MSWERVAIADVSNVVTGSTPKTDKDYFFGGDIPFVTPTELEQANPIVVTPRTLSEAGGQQVRLVPANAVLVCCIGSLGKVGIAGRELATNQQINAVVFDERKVWPKFGYYACRLLKPTLENMAPATTVAIVSKSKFQALEIPLPPLEEQKRIAAILDLADELRRKRQRSLDRLNQLGQAIFIEMFGDPARNPKRFQVSALVEVVSRVTDGEHQTPRRSDIGYKLLSARNVRDGYIDFDNVDYVDEEEFNRIAKRCAPKSGDILISCSGTIGRVAVVSTEEPFVLVRSAALVVPDETKISPHYLAEYLRTPYMFREMNQTANSSGQPNLFQNQIKRLPIMVPPLGEQMIFATLIREIRQKPMLDQEASLTSMKSLFASLQHRAFRGELNAPSLTEAAE